jgi:glutaredoxin 3
MSEKKIEFKEIDVSSDPTAANEMVKISGQMGVPVIDIGGQIIVGWNKDAIEEAISSGSAKKEVKEKKAA